MNIKNLIDEESIKKTAELYCRIWREPPWNEDFWKIKDVIKDLEKQSAKKNAIVLIATNGSRDVIGFTWGYEVSIKDLSQISGLSLNIWQKIINQRAFYVDEFGVQKEWRGNGVGQQLAQALIEQASLANKTLVLRTDVSAKSARTVYEKVGFEELSLHDAKHKDRTYWLKKIK